MIRIQRDRACFQEDDGVNRPSLVITESRILVYGNLAVPASVQ